MQLVTFTHAKRTPRVGILEGETITATAWHSDMYQLVKSGITPNRTSERYPLADCQLRPAIMPGKVIAVGRNYAAHAAEMGNDVPEEPVLFAKFPSSIIGPDDAITWQQAHTKQVDWEGELGVIIGKSARDLRPDDALKAIFGYIATNDVSARDLQDNDVQWTRAKAMDTFLPLSGVLTTYHELPDPQALHVKTTVSGTVMQNAATQTMIRPVADLIAYISRYFTLHPGDLILTGTPAGVGKAQNPPRYLADGDTVTVEIFHDDGRLISSVRNPCRVILEVPADLSE